MNQPSAVRDFLDESQIRQVYYPEAERLVQAATGASKVMVFDHNIRNGERAKQGLEGIKEPVKRVHNDFTAKSGDPTSPQSAMARASIELRSLVFYAP